MTQPSQHRINRLDLVSRWQNRPVDHQNWQVKPARRQYFGLRTTASGVFGHHQFDIVALQQRYIFCNSKRPARDYDMVMRQRRWHIGRIDQPQKIIVLWAAAKLGQMQPPNCQHNPLFWSRKRRDSRRNIANMLPAIPRVPPPWRSRQSQQPGRSLLARSHSIFAHLGRKRMRGINHMSDLVILQIAHQAANTTKAADPARDRLCLNARHATGIRQGCHHPSFGNRMSQRTGLERTAQNKQVRRHG